MSPLFFVGIPNWRSALLATVLTLPWLLALARGYQRRWQLWAAVAAGAVLFPISIAWVQVPIQQGLNALWSRLLDIAAIQRWLLAVALPSIVVSGLVQESVKLLLTAVAVRLLSKERAPLAGLAMGAAAGAGFGGFEAFWIFNQIFATGATWATVQLLGPVALLGFVERFFTVPFHIVAAALAGYGLASGRPWRFLLLAIGLHSLINYGALLVQAGVLGVAGVEVWIAVISLASVAGAFWLQRKATQPQENAGS